MDRVEKLLLLLAFSPLIVGVIVSGLIYAKTLMRTEVTIITCDDINQTKCLIVSESRDEREIKLPEPRKSFSVENPSSNTA